MAQETVVEFLFKQYKSTDIISNAQWNKARKMHKEEVKDAYDQGDIQLVNAEQYYNQTYKQNT